MNRIITLLLAVVLTPSFAQEIYKPFSVEREAVPKGGPAWLEKFIEVNRRMPYSAEVRKIKGVTFVSGVVEPDGSVSALRVTRSFDPACDREAMRVLKLFKAWQPALKEGKPVRQEFTYAVRFSPQLIGAEPDRIVAYYDKQQQLVVDEAQAAYQIIAPVDSLGYPTAGSTIYERRGKGWKEREKYAFSEKEKFIDNPDKTSDTDSIRVKHIFIRFMGRLQGEQYSYYPDGSLFAVRRYDMGRPAGKSRYYYPNGVVKREEEQLGEDKVRIWNWYSNGQIKQIMIQQASKGEFSDQTELLSQWDASGNQRVKDGQGVARFESQVEDEGRLIEEGRVFDGKRDSIWVGKVEGRPFYRETYSNGLCLGGVSFTTTGDSTVYKQSVQSAEFKGGKEALYQFLGQTMRYPPEAARNQIKGQVIVSFVVCTDGTLCDYEASGLEEESLKKEAVRVVKAMNGRWTPSIRHGKPVRTLFNLPINFDLQY
ncbi:energy transducer TonB [Tellurirhabdus bombi]|uniref:energy transducer TonB n=1 Tax=Tellurirhabdus bombi TaxID=2907205 RepID=UPI001F413779|nr:energy transducer TonB [Tellurirhabdus bombi]